MTEEEFVAIGKAYDEAKAAFEHASGVRLNAIVDARNDIGTTHMARLLGISQTTVAGLLRRGLKLRQMGVWY